MPPAVIRVLIADDQALVRGGLEMILEAQPDISVVASVKDGLEAVAAVARTRPDVALLDVRMPGSGGLEAARRILGGAAVTRVVMLTTFDADEYIFEALRAGASGFLLKDVPPADLVAAVRAVATGESMLAPSVTRRLIEAYVKRPPIPEGVPPLLRELTSRELDVMRLLAQGLTNSEIGSRLSVSAGTVKTHVGRLLSKIEARDRVQAVVLAYESGLVQPGGQPAPHWGAGSSGAKTNVSGLRPQ